MHTLNANSWYVALFIWTRHRLFQLTGITPKIDQANTCMILRTLFVYLPLIAALYAALIIGPFIMIFEPPISLLGIGMGSLKLLIGALYVCGGMAAMFGIIMLVWALCQGAAWTGGKIDTALEECRANPGFCTLVLKCLIDMHNKVCTRYKIEGGR